VVIGRSEETAALLGGVDDAVSGRASTSLVSGEAGIGKTSLAGSVGRSLSERVRVLWASCLPLGSLTAPFLPLRGAGPSDPAFWTATDILVRYDAWLDELTAERPVLLVVDDVQWADQSSLDVLMYVIAGRADRRLAIIVTIRDGTGGDRLTAWLSDVRRLPRVAEIPLGHLDRAGTGEQITGLFGRPPDERLVDEVHARTQGNPYLTSLLVRDLDPTAAALPAGRPAALRDALTRTWRAMSAPARELTRIITVAGRPQPVDRLIRIALALDFTAAVLPLLRESVDAGVLRPGPGPRYWFAHPLLAEILEADLLPDERRVLHTAFASDLDSGAELAPDEVAELADHYLRAGMIEPAYRWALRAAGMTTAAAERLRLLHRALSLSERLGEPDAGRTGLWRRIRDAADQAGRQAEELEAIEALLARARPDDDPLGAAALMIHRSSLREWMGIELLSIADARAARSLTARFPDSAEHALATARLAGALIMQNDETGIDLAREAVHLARNSGSVEAIVFATIADVDARLMRHDRSGHEDARQAVGMAAEARLFMALKGAAYTAANSYPGTSARGIADIFHHAMTTLTALGAPHAHVAEMCAWEANMLLAAGDWRGCRARLRVALGARPGPRGDAVARLTAAELAARQGRPGEAEAHLARAEELLPAYDVNPGLDFDHIRTLVGAALDDPAQTFALARRGLGRTSDQLSEFMVPMATRALADLADAARDRGDDPAPVIARLADLHREFPAVVADPVDDVRRRALRALIEAENLRGRRGPGEPVAWRRAADECRAAEMPWDEAYARWRQSQAALRDRTTSPEATSSLRRAHRLAAELQAQPLLTDVERLARNARITLTTGPDPAPAELPGLTVREREVLGHVLIGRTNAEIAKTLVLSDKTVSVHISNMLRKTGAANRIQLAELVARQRKSAAREV
jgi:DNA-binding CsgD family transcriptional regulator/tetratricopeptide (TPR) repeat protein